MANLRYVFLLLAGFIIQPVASFAAPPNALPSSTASASPMGKQDEANLLRAIEDYRFNDFEEAIAALEKLHLIFPNDQQTIQYLALSYQESGNTQKAIPLFQTWLSNSDQSTQDDAQFAWVGLASAFISNKEYAKAAKALQTWLKAHPQDIATQIMLGDVYVRDGAYAKADKVWALVLKDEQSNTSQQAAAWYYKGWAAYLDGEDQQSKTFTQQSLGLDNIGAYANAATQLLTAEPIRKTGFVGSVSLESFWSSNVKLLPDYQTSSTSSNPGSNRGAQVNIFLGWQNKSFETNYLLSATKYAELNEYDLMLHMLSGSWINKEWRLTPTFERVSLHDEHLYQGFGLGSYYSHQNWTYHYSLKFKSFSDTFGPDAADLSRLSGTNHNLGISHAFTSASIKSVFSSDIFAERTKGDATHNQTDDCIQIGVSLRSSLPLNDITALNTIFSLYNRRYAGADSSIMLNPDNAPKRSDSYGQVTASVVWSLLSDKSLALQLNSSWIKNLSNYDENVVVEAGIKSYSTFRIGGLISKQW